ncbi:DUF305 domain-containing protein [Cellulomonas hominis]
MNDMPGMSSSPSSPTGTEETADFNDADVTFATDMIPHHRQAVEMANLAPSRAQNQQVMDLAMQIQDAQDPEIQTMSGWLTAWGKPVPEDMSGMDMSGSMPGMMSAEEMSELEGMSGAEFDEMFLEMMIKHHQGAIRMAETELADVENPDAIALAQQVKAAQTAEIATMKGLLR